MAKARFAYDNLCTAAATTVTASTAVTDRPASFLKNPARWKKWRSTTTTGDQWVVFDFGAAKNLQAFLLADYKAHTSGGTIKVQTSPDNTIWTDRGTFTLPSTNPTKVIAIWLGSVLTFRYVRFYLTNVGVVSDYVELGVAFAGVYFQPTYNIVDGFQWERVDPSVVVAADGGQESAYARTHYYRTRGQFAEMPGADKDSFVTMIESVGQRTPLFFGTDPDDPDETVYSRFDAPLSLTQVYGDTWTIGLSVQEHR